jgi:Mrp family chromosome partitioning ATPase
MSHLFDALQKSEAERSGNGDKSSLSATELLHFMERETAVQQQSAAVMGTGGMDAANPLEFLVAAGTQPSSVPQADLKEPLQQGNEPEGLELRTPELEMEQKQRDEITRFIQHMFLMPGAPRTVVLTGIEPGNGCSWICCRAAHLLTTQLKGSVCVVDANLRSPGLHQIYGLENHHGLSDALERSEPITTFLRPLGRPNLWLLSCGADVPNRNPLLNAERLRARIAELRQYFEYVLIDSPALSLGSDTILLGRAAEAVVLVLKANSTRREAARKAVQDLQNAGVRVLGAVLNQRTFPIPQSIYSKL